MVQNKDDRAFIGKEEGVTVCVEEFTMYNAHLCLGSRYCMSTQGCIPSQLSQLVVHSLKCVSKVHKSVAVLFRIYFICEH